MEDDRPLRLPLVLEGLVVRRVLPEDCWDLLEYWSMPEVARYQILEEYNEDHVTAWIKTQGSIVPGDPRNCFSGPGKGVPVVTGSVGRAGMNSRISGSSIVHLCAEVAIRLALRRNHPCAAG